MTRLLLSAAALAGLALPAVADDWPQWLGPTRDGVWRETGILRKFPAGGPKVLWETKVGLGYAGPAVAAGRVYVMDLVPAGGAAPGDSGRGAKGVERTLCLDEATGAVKWTHEYPVDYRIQYAAGPRCTPTVDGDRVYALGAMGHLHCYDAATGKVIWAKDFVKEYEAHVNIWGFAAHPLVEGDTLVCLVGGSGQRLVVAFDKATGKDVWTSQQLMADAGYCAPIIYTLGGKRTLVVWHSRAVVGLDPATGKRLWTHPWEIKYALNAAMPRLIGPDTLFFTSFYNGPLALKIEPGDKPKVLWKGREKGERPEQTDGLHSIMPTPYLKDGHLYGVCSYGELRCLDAATGKRVWETRKATVGTPTEEGAPTRWGNAFLTPNGDHFYIFNEQGELVVADLTPAGYTEIDRAKIVPPTNKLAGRPVVWCHPAYANKCLFVRNDEKLVCVSLAE